jgi:hypothetical protein
LRRRRIAVVVPPVRLRSEAERVPGLNRIQFEMRRSATSGSGTGDRSGFGLRANETYGSKLDAV